MQLGVWWAGSNSNAFRLFWGFNKLKCLQFCDMQGHTSKGEENREGPAWAPLRNNYMLTNSKLKDWDKMPVRTVFIYTMLNVYLVG